MCGAHVLSTGIAVAGSDSLAPGAVRPAAAQQAAPQVHLFRGFANVFSLGLDTMAGELRDAGVPAVIHVHLAAASVAKSISARYRQDRRNAPIILIGHSLGAGAVASLAERLNRDAVPVDLLVMIGLVRKVTVPPNVARAINVQPNRTDGQVTAAPGMNGQIINVDLNKRPGIVDSGRTNHFNIESNPQLHKWIIDQVLEVVRRGARKAS